MSEPAMTLVTILRAVAGCKYLQRLPCEIIFNICYLARPYVCLLVRNAATFRVLFRVDDIKNYSCLSPGQTRAICLHVGSRISFGCGSVRYIKPGHTNVCISYGMKSTPSIGAYGNTLYIWWNGVAPRTDLCGSWLKFYHCELREGFPHKVIFTLLIIRKWW